MTSASSAKKTLDDTATIVINPVVQERITIYIHGESPLIMERMSQKAFTELLCPSGRKTSAAKRITIKHNPVQEFRNSLYICPNIFDKRTLLGFPASAIKNAMMTAALDLPSVTKTQIGRLVSLLDEYIPIFGLPRLFMSVVRMADMNRTPDIRTRAILPEWAAIVRIGFTTPQLTPTAIVNLLAAAGQLCGIGGWRQEKGKGSFGRFTIVDTSENLNHLIRDMVAEQQQAIDCPVPYDAESAALLEWWQKEIVARGIKVEE